MKRLQWYTKILTSIKGRLFVLYSLLFAFNFFSHAIFVGCVEKFEKNKPEEIPQAKNKSDSHFLEYIPFLPRSRSLLFKDSSQDLVLGELSPFKCDDKKNTAKPSDQISFTTTLHSNFIDDTIIISADPEEGESLKYSIKNHNYSVKDKDLRERFLSLACGLQESKEDKISLKKDDVKILEEVVIAGTTGCISAEALSSGWRCVLPKSNAISAGAIEKNLIDLQGSLLRNYKRLPYTFARKVAVSLLLARALDKEDENDHKGFCNLISDGGAVLPIAIGSENFYKYYCKEPFTRPKELGGTVLNMALNEINIMNILMQKHTKIGLLSIKLPGAGSADVREYLVQVIPGKDVEVGLSEELKNIAKEHAAKSSATNPKGCWHPLFGIGTLDYSSAHKLAMIDASEEACLKLPGSQKNDEQILTSITASELEFRVARGRSKIIRLPLGHYTYKVFVDTSFENNTSPPKAIFDGAFIWDDSKNQHTLSQIIN